MEFADIVNWLSILFGFLGVFGIGVTNQYKRRIDELEEELAHLKDTCTSLSEGVHPLNGVFEIHITIDPKENYVSLLNFVRTYEKALKLIFAVSSVGNNQYMISHFTRKMDEQDVVRSANKMADDMRLAGILVNRIKVESHGATGTPLTKTDYNLFYDYILKKYTKSAGKPYFEFHLKVNKITGNLENDVKEFKGVAISYNICGVSKLPLLTIRVYDDGFHGAQQYKDQVVGKLKSKGYTFEDKIQEEFSVFDTNAQLDKGWLF
jgi:hypothetical protein